MVLLDVRELYDQLRERYNQVLNEAAVQFNREVAEINRQADKRLDSLSNTSKDPVSVYKAAKAAREVREWRDQQLKALSENVQKTMESQFEAALVDIRNEFDYGPDGMLEQMADSPFRKALLAQQKAFNEGLDAVEQKFMQAGKQLIASMADPIERQQELFKELFRAFKAKDKAAHRKAIGDLKALGPASDARYMALIDELEVKFDAQTGTARRLFGSAGNTSSGSYNSHLLKVVDYFPSQLDECDKALAGLERALKEAGQPNQQEAIQKLRDLRPDDNEFQVIIDNATSVSEIRDYLITHQTYLPQAARDTIAAVQVDLTDELQEALSIDLTEAYEQATQEKHEVYNAFCAALEQRKAMLVAIMQDPDATDEAKQRAVKDVFNQAKDSAFRGLDAEKQLHWDKAIKAAEAKFAQQLTALQQDLQQKEAKRLRHPHKEKERIAQGRRDINKRYAAALQACTDPDERRRILAAKKAEIQALSQPAITLSSGEPVFPEQLKPGEDYELADNVTMRVSDDGMLTMSANFPKESAFKFSKLQMGLTGGAVLATALIGVTGPVVALPIAIGLGASMMRSQSKRQTASDAKVTADVLNGVDSFLTFVDPGTEIRVSCSDPALQAQMEAALRQDGHLVNSLKASRASSTAAAKPTQGSRAAYNEKRAAAAAKAKATGQGNQHGQSTVTVRWRPGT